VGLLDLVAEIKQGTLALPEFQRDFEWQEDRVEALLTTLLKGWPAGSLLFLEASESLFFAPRRFHGGPHLPENFRGTIVLDGQQRLTSAYHALTGAGDSIYAILMPLDRPVPTEVDDVEEIVTTFTKSQWRRMSATNHPVVHEDSLVVPFSVLESISGTYKWMGETASALESAYPGVGERLRILFAELLENLQTYSFPAVVVDSNVQAAAVARIFERVNRNGEPLSTFDLLVAKTFREGWNMRDLWRDACVEHPSLDLFFGKSGVVAAETIALNSERPSVRKAEILNLDADHVRLGWPAAIDAVEATISRLATDCGSDHPSLLPYGVMVPLYSALAVRNPALLGQAYDLRRHFLLSGLSLRFDVAANTRVVEEFRLLSEAGLAEFNAASRHISRLALSEATRQSHAAINRAIVSMLTQRVAGSGAINSVDLIPANLWPRREGSNLHLRAASAVVVPREAARIANREGAIALLDSEVGDLLRLQWLPGASSEDQEFYHEARVEQLIAHLRDEYGAVVED
jgi:hypothetical protein